MTYCHRGQGPAQTGAGLFVVSLCKELAMFITIEVPEEFALELEPYREQLAELLERGPERPITKTPFMPKGFLTLLQIVVD